MAIIDSIRERELGFEEEHEDVSLRIEPVVYERAGELTLALEFDNQRETEIGVDFDLLELVGSFGAESREVVAAFVGVTVDTKFLLRSGKVVSRASLKQAVRARFALGANLLRVAPGGRVVVHSEPFARAPLDEAAEKCERIFGVLLALRVVIADASGAELLAEKSIVCLPKAWVRRPRPDDAVVLSPSMLLVEHEPEREAALARTHDMDPSRLAPGSPTIDADAIGQLRLFGYPYDDASPQPIHTRALDELAGLLARARDGCEGMELDIVGHADSGLTDAARRRADALALRRAESVRAWFCEVLGLELDVRTNFEDSQDRGVALRLYQRDQSSSKIRLAPMYLHAWPGAPNSYPFDAEFPLLARAWRLTPLTLADLREVHRNLPLLAAALAPDRVRGKPRVVGRRWSFPAGALVRDLLDKLEPTRSLVDTNLPSPWTLSRLVEPFGGHVPLLAHLSIIVRRYALTVDELVALVGREQPSAWFEWIVRLLTVLVDQWQPASERGSAARLDRLRAITNETELVPALVVAIAHESAQIDLLASTERMLARQDYPRPDELAERARQLGLDELRSEAGLAAWAAQQEEFRAAVDRPDLPDILGEYDRKLDNFLALIRSRIG